MMEKIAMILGRIDMIIACNEAESQPTMLEDDSSVDRNKDSGQSISLAQLNDKEVAMKNIHTNFPEMTTFQTLFQVEGEGIISDVVVVWK